MSVVRHLSWESSKFILNTLKKLGLKGADTFDELTHLLESGSDRIGVLDFLALVSCV